MQVKDFFYNIKLHIKRSSLLKDSSWALFGSAMENGLSLLCGVIVARLLGRDIFGEYGIVKTTLIQIAIFSTFGLGYTITHFVSKDRSESGGVDVICLYRFSMQTTFLTSTIIAFFVFLFAYPLSVLLDAPNLSSMLRIISLAVICNAIKNTQIGLMSGLNLFSNLAKNNIIVGLISFVLSIFLTYWLGLFGAVVSLLLSRVFSCIFNYFSIKKELIKYEFNGSRYLNHVQKISVLSFSLPIALQESLYAVINWAVAFVIIKFSSYGELGIYNAANQWGAIICFIPGILRNVMLTYFSSSLNNPKGHSHLVNVMLLVAFVITFLIALIIFCLSGTIVSFYGEDFKTLKVVLLIVVFYSIFTGLMSVLQQEFISRGKNWLLLISRVIRDLFLILLIIMKLSITSDNGAFWVATLTGVTTVLYTLFLFVYYKRILFKE